ncbi:tetratricopeptide repeat protein [Ferrovibrio sp.]|uniref:tetratricopeptide repeat protein n=1 Tax=Ferrovibrio sp. TaxID=1917215 RepID=UPI0035B3D01F
MQTDTLLHRANVALQSGKRAEAEAGYSAALAADPHNSAALFGMGNAYMDAGRMAEALAFYRAASEADPGNVSARLNAATALKRLGLNEEAADAFEALHDEIGEVEALRPIVVNLLGNWSGCYINAGAPEKALELAMGGLALDPGNHDLNNHAGLALLELGRWGEARRYWDKRLTRRGFHVRDFGCPEWDGGETEVLAIHGEQGIGDEVMFMTALDYAEARAYRVVVECTPRLAPAFERSLGVPCYGSPEELMAKEKPTAKVAMGTLFMMARPVPEDCTGAPYLLPDPDLVNFYKARLALLGRGPKVGIAWRGGTDKTHAAVRTPPFQQFEHVLGEHTLISLQYGDAAFEADLLGAHHWQRAIDDIEHQIALISCLDRVVSVCQSVVHFAGALGVPCDVIVPDKPRWCYHQSGETMALYHSVRLHRQQRGTWPFAQIADSLAQRRAAA